MDRIADQPSPAKSLYPEEWANPEITFCPWSADSMTEPDWPCKALCMEGASYGRAFSLRLGSDSSPMVVLTAPAVAGGTLVGAAVVGAAVVGAAVVGGTLVGAEVVVFSLKAE